MQYNFAKETPNEALNTSEKSVTNLLSKKKVAGRDTDIVGNQRHLEASNLIAHNRAKSEKRQRRDNEE